MLLFLLLGYLEFNAISFVVHLLMYSKVSRLKKDLMTKIRKKSLPYDSLTPLTLCDVRVIGKIYFPKCCFPSASFIEGHSNVPLY